MFYFDYSAGAPLRADVRAHLVEAFGATGNPSSVHQAGRPLRRRLMLARERVARVLGAAPKDVVFTASGSEAAALALVGAWKTRPDANKRRVVSSAIEHPCVLGALDRLEGAEVVRIAPDATGRVPLDAFADALTADTALASLMWANNETGVVQPAPEVARLCETKGIVFHTDAVQAVGRLDATLRNAPGALVSISGHKLGAPSGVGALLARRELPLAALVPGHQEDGRRGGTENVVFAESLAIALERSREAIDAEASRLNALRAGLEQRLVARLPGVVVHGAGVERIAGVSSLRVEGIEGEALMIALDLQGFCVSTGAACASGSIKPSHVLTAMGLSAEQAKGAIRISMGWETSAAAVNALADALVDAVERASHSR